jgi:hypothetical protein
VTVDQPIQSSLDKNFFKKAIVFSKKNQTGKIRSGGAVKEKLPIINISLTGGNL